MDRENKRLKLCPYCEGRIDLEVIACPFCGNDVMHHHSSLHNNASLQEEHEQDSFSEKETVASLYPPPYQPKAYDVALDEEQEEVQEEVMQEEEVVEKSPFLSILFFSLGVNLFFVGLLLFFFSSQKEVFLKCNSQFWFVYLAVSLPFLVIGYKKISKLR